MKSINYVFVLFISLQFSLTVANAQNNIYISLNLEECTNCLNMLKRVKDLENLEDINIIFREKGRKDSVELVGGLYLDDERIKIHFDDTLYEKYIIPRQYFNSSFNCHFESSGYTLQIPLAELREHDRLLSYLFDRKSTFSHPDLDLESKILKFSFGKVYYINKIPPKLVSFEIIQDSFHQFGIQKDFIERLFSLKYGPSQGKEIFNKNQELIQQNQIAYPYSFKGFDYLRDTFYVTIFCDSLAYNQDELFIYSVPFLIKMHNNRVMGNWYLKEQTEAEQEAINGVLEISEVGVTLNNRLISTFINFKVDPLTHEEAKPLVELHTDRAYLTAGKKLDYLIPSFFIPYTADIATLSHHPVIRQNRYAMDRGGYTIYDLVENKQIADLEPIIGRNGLYPNEFLSPKYLIHDFRVNNNMIYLAYRLTDEPEIVFLKLENNNGVIKEVKKLLVKAKSTNFVAIDDFDYNCWVYPTSDTTLTRVKIF